jgi:hypothetical protein
MQGFQLSASFVYHSGFCAKALLAIHHSSVDSWPLNGVDLATGPKEITIFRTEEAMDFKRIA